MDNKEIIRRCLKNNRKGQEALYEKYRKQCFGICLRYARCEDDANDIFQEAFIKVFKNLNSLKAPEALFGWIKSIIVRTALRYYPSTFTDSLDSMELEVIGDDAEKLISNIDVNELLKYINKLPDGYRKVFNLYVIDGYKHREIAEVLGISENTSKSQYHDAKSYLKKELLKIGISKHYNYG